MEGLALSNEQEIASAAVLGLMLVAALGYVLANCRRKRSRGDASGTVGRFNLLATKAGGRVTAERLVAGALRQGAASRAEAIERAMDQLDRDRRSWR